MTTVLTDHEILQ